MPGLVIVDQPHFDNLHVEQVDGQHDPHRFKATSTRQQHNAIFDPNARAFPDRCSVKLAPSWIASFSVACLLERLDRFARLVKRFLGSVSAMGVQRRFACSVVIQSHRTILRKPDVFLAVDAPVLGHRLAVDAPGLPVALVQ